MIETAERRAFVLRLRKGGATYERIRDAAIKEFTIERLPKHWDERSVYKDVARELKRINGLRNGLAVDVQQLELERLDEMQLRLWPRAMQGDERAIRTILAIMERRDKILGVDAAQRVKHEGTGDNGEIEIKQVELTDAERAAALRAMLGDGRLSEENS